MIAQTADEGSGEARTRIARSARTTEPCTGDKDAIDAMEFVTVMWFTRDSDV